MTNVSKETLAAAADRFRVEKRIPSWINDTSVAESLAGAMNQSISEHSGRWLYELFQNAEDAGANYCKVQRIGGAIVITDDGTGIPLKAIKSLITPFITSKDSNQSIGRKGIGFCSVYKITNNPMIWTLGTGIEFSPEKTATLLEEQPELESLYEIREDLPYLHALLPFGISDLPDDILQYLGNTANQGTSIILPIKDSFKVSDVLQSFEDLDHRFLLTFKTLKHMSYSVDGEVKWELNRSDAQIGNIPHLPNTYRIIKQVKGQEALKERYAVWTQSVNPPQEILDRCFKSRKDRKRLATCETSIISPINEKGDLLPLKAAAPIFVYYPTEVELPLQLIVHGDFTLDTPRKHLNETKSGTLNAYLLQVLTGLIIDVSNSLIRSHRYSEAFQILKSHNKDDLEAIIPNFTSRIQREILLPTTDNSLRPLDRIIYPNYDIPAREDAMRIINFSDRAESIAADALCEPEFKKKLRDYTNLWFDDTDVLKVLKNLPKLETPSDEMLWCKTAWTWLSRGYDQISLESYSRTSLQTLQGLKIIPTSSGIIAADDRGHLPCLASSLTESTSLPEWLKFDVIPQHFSSWVQELPVERKRLAQSLGIKSFSEEFIVNSLLETINDGNADETRPSHQEALDFIKSRKWPNHPDLEHFRWPKTTLGNLLVPTKQGDTSGWAPAQNAYFGVAWTGLDLESLYSDSCSPNFISDHLKHEWPEAHNFFELCGVKAYPRLQENDLTPRKVKQFWDRMKEEIPPNQKKNIKDPERLNGYTGPRLEQFQGMNINALDSRSGATLLQLLHLGWTDDYASHVDSDATFMYHTKWSTYSTHNIWFCDLQSELYPPCRAGRLIEQAPLGQLWIKTPDTLDWPLELFPKLHLEEINDGDEFREWIIATGLARTLVSQIPYNEWEDVIFPALAEKIQSADAGTSKDAAQLVRQTYKGFLKCMHGHDEDINIPQAYWHDDTLKLATTYQPVWAVFSENDLKEWQRDLPVFLFSQKEKAHHHFKKLGYWSLEDHLEQRLIEQSEDSEAVDETERVQHFIAWIYALRCNTVEAQPPLTKWQQLTATVVAVVEIENTLDGFSRRSTTSHFYDSEQNRLHLTVNASQQDKNLARALVDSLNIPPTLTNQLEILLGNNEKQRHERLLDDGFIESDLDQWLAEYRGENLEPEEAAIIPSPVIPEPIPAPIVPENPNQSQTVIEPASAEPKTDEAPAILHSKDVAPQFPEPIPPVTPSPLATDTAPTTRPTRAQPKATGSTLNRNPRQIPRDALTVEDRSREFVKQALEAQGYTVTPLQQNNPGYDMDARRGDEVLFVEVKGNKAATDHVHFTPTELETYKNAGNGYTWQLWHVSCLAEDSGEQPVIRIYDTLPEHTLSPEVYILNLSECPQTPPPEVHRPKTEADSTPAS